MSALHLTVHYLGIDAGWEGETPDPYGDLSFQDRLISELTWLSDRGVSDRALDEIRDAYHHEWRKGHRRGVTYRQNAEGGRS